MSKTYILVLKVIHNLWFQSFIYESIFLCENKTSLYCNDRVFYRKNAFYFVMISNQIYPLCRYYWLCISAFYCLALIKPSVLWKSYFDDWWKLLYQNVCTFQKAIYSINSSMKHKISIMYPNVKQIFWTLSRNQ